MVPASELGSNEFAEELNLRRNSITAARSDIIKEALASIYKYHTRSSGDNQATTSPISK